MTEVQLEAVESEAPNSTPPSKFRRVAGTIADRCNIVFVAEGYTKGRLEAFRTKTEEIADHLMSLEPFNGYVLAFNLYRLPFVSSDKALTGRSRFKTARHAHPRAFTVDTLAVRKEVEAHIDSPEVIVMLFDIEEEIGAAFNNVVGLAAGTSTAGSVAAHEIGHGLIGLADEYPYRLGCGLEVTHTTIVNGYATGPIVAAFEAPSTDPKPHLLGYDPATGAVRFDHLHDQMDPDEPSFTDTWSTGWTSMSTFRDADGAWFLLSYKASGPEAGRVAIDELHADGQGTASRLTHGKWPKRVNAVFVARDPADGALYAYAYQEEDPTVAFPKPKSGRLFVYPLDRGLKAFGKHVEHPFPAGFERLEPAEINDQLMFFAVNRGKSRVRTFTRMGDGPPHEFVGAMGEPDIYRFTGLATGSSDYAQYAAGARRLDLLARSLWSTAVSVAEDWSALLSVRDGDRSALVINYASASQRLEWRRVAPLEPDHDVYTGAEPIEPNVTCVPGPREQVKWGAHILPTTPLPTDVNEDRKHCPRPADADPRDAEEEEQEQEHPVDPVVGTFEGARNYHGEIYRPAAKCTMNVSTDPFCAVCKEAITSHLGPYFGACEVFATQWDTGWESLVAFERDGDACLVVENVKTGRRRMDVVNPGGLDTTNLWDLIPSDRLLFASQMLALDLGVPHLFAYQPDTGKFAIHEVLPGDQGLVRVGGGQWGKHWSHIVPYRLASGIHLLQYRAITGEIAIDHVGTTAGSATVTPLFPGAAHEHPRWSKEWTAFAVYDVGGQAHLLAYQRQTGVVGLDLLLAAGQGSKNVTTVKIAPQFTSVLALESVDGPLVMFHNAKTGALSFYLLDGLTVDRAVWASVDHAWIGWSRLHALPLPVPPWFIAYDGATGGVSINDVMFPN